MTLRRHWTRDELFLTINLYCKTPFGRIHYRNPDVIKLAKLINRTPGAVSFKMANFAHLDDSLLRQGAANVSKLDREVWIEFFSNLELNAFESEQQLAKLEGADLTLSSDVVQNIFPEGKETLRHTKMRINQSFFRQTVLATYEYKCCITGITIPKLLIASHIVPWSLDQNNRLNPCNGLCLNALHDKAFDSGLLSFSDSYEIIISEDLKSSCSNNTEKVFLLNYEGQQLTLPKKFIPDKEFIRYHRNSIFIQ